MAIFTRKDWKSRGEPGPVTPVSGPGLDDLEDRIGDAFDQVLPGGFVDQDALAAAGLKLEVSFARDGSGDPVLEPDGSIAIENIRIVSL